MTEYIRREAVLKSLEYTTVWEAEAENVIALTLRAAREKVEKLPALQEKDLFPAWRNPETDPPKVETEADPFAELEGWESLDQIQEAYGYGEITSDRRDKLTDLWEARETAQRKGKKDGKYHDLVTDMLARAIHSVGIEYADEIAAYEEERRMRRSYYEKVENRANGLQEEEPEEEPDPLSPARAAIATAMQAAKVSEVTGAPLPKPLTWKRGFYDTTRTFPSGWYECPVCGCRVDWEPEQCPKCYTRLELEETEG